MEGVIDHINKGIIGITARNRAEGIIMCARKSIRIYENTNLPTMVTMFQNIRIKKMDSHELPNSQKP